VQKKKKKNHFTFLQSAHSTFKKHLITTEAEFCSLNYQSSHIFQGIHMNFKSKMKQKICFERQPFKVPSYILKDLQSTIPSCFLLRLPARHSGIPEAQQKANLCINIIHT